MATFSVIIRSNSGELKNVKINLHHRRGLAVFSTPYWVRDDEFRNGIIVKRTDASVLNMRIAALIEDYIRVLGKIDYPETYTCSQLKRIILSGLDSEGNTPFGDYARSYIRNLKADGRDSYADMVERSVRYFISFGGNLPLRAIRPELIQDWQRHLINKRKAGSREKVSKSYVGICLSHVKAILNAAVRDRKVMYEVHPFISTKIGRSAVKESAVQPDTIVALRDAKPKTRHHIVSRDMFMLSFYLGGMNLADMLVADFRKGEVRYKRRKTADRTDLTTIIPLIPQAREIIDRYMTKNGHLNLRYSFSDKNLRNYISRGITEMAEDMGLEKVIFYSARKTFSQIGQDLGIPDAVINATLGHSDSSRGIISYYSHVRPPQVRDAIERIVRSLDPDTLP